MVLSICFIDGLGGHSLQILTKEIQQGSEHVISFICFIWTKAFPDFKQAG